MKKVLFISHDASRTGAPIILLNLLQWLKEHSEIPFDVLLKRGGKLEADFAAIAPTSLYTIRVPKRQGLRTEIRRVLHLEPDRQKQHLERLRHTLLQENIGAIYANTVINTEIVEWLSFLECPVICHVHELEYVIRKCIGLEPFERLKSRIDHYIVVSNAVKHNLMERHAIDESRIDVIHGFIPLLAPNVAANREIRASLNIPQEALLVCGSGRTDWRKGVDLFIRLAQAVHARRHNVPIYFLWLGEIAEMFTELELQYDVEHLGLQEYMRFPGIKTNPMDYFAACDLFAQVSREDPFPLVCLEAASFGKPTICFDHTGGAPEFVETDAGWVVPYADVDAMAQKLLEALDDPEMRQRLGERARQKARERHDINVVAPDILRTIQRFLR